MEATMIKTNLFCGKNIEEIDVLETFPLFYCPQNPCTLPIFFKKPLNLHIKEIRSRIKLD